MNDMEILSPQQARILGCLMEKQFTTPNYYPLTLKALTTACNQKSSRVPVMNLSASEVGGVVNGLRNQGLITARMDSRADRFEQQLSRKLKISSQERAVLNVLMLRSALTLNEIRIHTGPMVDFESSEALQTLLEQMITRETPLLVRIPRTAGQREDRYAHLLCGEPEIDPTAPAQADSMDGNPIASDRLDQLEKEVADLKSQMGRLWQLTGLNEQQS